MNLRWRLLLIFGSIVIGTVALVSYVASVGARKAFHTFEDNQVDAIQGQFGRE